MISTDHYNRQGTVDSLASNGLWSVFVPEVCELYSAENSYHSQSKEWKHGVVESTLPDNELRAEVFVLFSVIVSSLLQLFGQAFLNDPTLSVLASGPYGLIFSSFVPFYFDIPVSTRFRVSSLAFSDKSFIYLAGLQAASIVIGEKIPNARSMWHPCWFSMSDNNIVLRIRRLKATKNWALLRILLWTCFVPLCGMVKWILIIWWVTHLLKMWAEMMMNDQWALKAMPLFHHLHQSLQLHNWSQDG